MADPKDNSIYDNRVINEGIFQIVIDIQGKNTQRYQITDVHKRLEARENWVEIKKSLMSKISLVLDKFKPETVK